MTSMPAILSTFELRSDIYKMQRRPRNPHLLVNDDDVGIRILDPWTGQDVARIPVGDPPFMIGDWALRADGAAVVVFDDEHRRGFHVSLPDGAVRALPYPPWQHTVGAPYDWRDDVLWLKDPESTSFWRLDGRLEPTVHDGFETLTGNRAWRRATDRLRRANAAAYCVAAERMEMLTIGCPLDDPRMHIGRIGWAGQPDLSVPVPERVVGVEVIDQTLIGLYEDAAIAFTPDGQHVARLAAPPEFRFGFLAHLPESDARQSAVVVLAYPHDGTLRARFSVHPAPGPADGMASEIEVFSPAAKTWE